MRSENPRRASLGWKVFEGPQRGAKSHRLIQIDNGNIQAPLGNVVRSSAEETLDATFEAEANSLKGSEHYKPTEPCESYTSSCPPS